MAIRSASAVWNGSLKEGNGQVSVESGTFSDTNYSFGKRFGEDKGLNPEELIAAAHASCFSMAFSAQLGERVITPEAIQTTAQVTMEAGTLTKSHLITSVRAPGADEAKVQEAATAAKETCPISKALNLEITLDLNVEV